MAKRALPELWIVRVARGHARLWFAIALGGLTYLALPGSWYVVTRALVGWDLGVALYLAAAAVMMSRASVSDIRKHSRTAGRRRVRTDGTDRHRGDGQSRRDLR